MPPCTEGRLPWVHSCNQGSQPWVQQVTSGLPVLKIDLGLAALVTFLDPACPRNTRAYRIWPQLITPTCVLPGNSAPVTRCHWGWVSEAAKALPLVPAPLPLVDPGVRVDHGAVTVPIDDPTKTLATWQLSQIFMVSTSDCLSTLPGSCLPELGSFLDNQKLSELLSNYFSSSYSVYYRLIIFPRQEFQPKLHSWIMHCRKIR